MRYTNLRLTYLLTYPLPQVLTRFTDCTNRQVKFFTLIAFLMMLQTAERDSARVG